MSDTKQTPPVQALVLDAHPLITQHFSTLSTYASSFFTTPSVFQEIKDENARRNLELWKEKLTLRHPKPVSINRVSEFAKLTGDLNVLSAQDIHIIALALELDIEEHGTDEHIRNFPGEKKQAKQEEEEKEVEDPKVEETLKTPADDDAEVKVNEEVPAKKKNRRRGGKKQRAKREAEAQAKLEMEESESKEPQVTEELETTVEEIAVTDNSEILQQVDQPTEQNEINDDDDDDDDDDDGEWITESNLLETIQKDSGERLEESKNHHTTTKVALSSQDFAVQNVAIQMGLKLMNTATGLQIKRIRNYMLRCHACFRLQPPNESKHFCASCGGATLLRCVVVVDAKTGEMKPLLKKNFEWHNRGNRYSIASPLSKNTQKKLGKGGFQNNKNSKYYDAHNNVPILRADQKEYGKALKNENWTQRQNEKFLENWIGGGSADNFYSPFANGDSSNRYHSNVKVNPGRHANSSRRRR
ncbi:rRNA-binding endoribonuclease [Saccharomycopsis crataegensis]|uniref:20S-pre-rRNA D-site endonuclease NOB1 n=1 Tax=Saccharomycopsis crataegensis TaxID=43959 RepID=A0AAV5QV04_9ASCO|nr:rRNA-binding endoribonuclease [Saccharomycopsis crataegensis]